MNPARGRRQIGGGRSGKAGAAKKTPAIPQGWRTTDEQEIERRRQRALEESFEIEPLEPDRRFGSFRVGLQGGRRYVVEIRALDRCENSCDCPDFQINGLGFCKHVAATLAWVQRRARPAAGGRHLAATRTSGRVEVYLRRSAGPPEVRIEWPQRGAVAGRTLVTPFVSASGKLAGNPLAVLPQIARRLEQAPAQTRRQIRLSRHLMPWVEEERRRVARAMARQRFLAEVAAGRKTLDVLKRPLYPYQHEGMLHLAFTERALLADEMGLGKTVQAIAACELLRRLRGVERALVVCPASLKGEWQEQIALFSDLPVRIVEGPRGARLRQYEAGAFFYLVNYEQVLFDGEDINRLLAPDIVILDEAQRIKNWRAKTAQAVKRLASPYAFILTGTPIENRIDEVYSLVQFLDPALLGALFRFNREFYSLDDRGRAIGAKNLGALSRRLGAVLLRRRKLEVEGQLPERTAKTYLVPMDAEQESRYAEYQRKAARLAALAERRPLTPAEFDQLQGHLAAMRMICDTPYILDSDCRVCPKLNELREILEELLADPKAKILIFSEWVRMLELVRELAEELGTDHALHTGALSLARRREEIRRFKEDPACRLFLSTDSGGVGLNLQVANVVINLDLPWNPARLEQRFARAWRKHQTRAVQAIHLVTQDSIEHRMMAILAHKAALADVVLDGSGGDEVMTGPGGRAAFLERVTAVLTPPPPAAPPPRPVERLRDDLLEQFGGGLLRLELRADPARGETVLGVFERADEAVRATAAACVERHFAGMAAPALAVVDGAAYSALIQLEAMGIAQLVSPAEVLHDSQAAGASTAEASRRTALARAVSLPAVRKVRMAAVLADGGFPIEALAPLRDGVEGVLRALAALDGIEPAESEALSPRLHDRLLHRDGIDSAVAALAARLGGDSSALLAVEEGDALALIATGERFAAEVGALLDRLDPQR